MPRFADATARMFQTTTARESTTSTRADPGNQLFDPSPFSPETIGVLGNSNRRFFHGPGFNNWDMALRKNTMIGERMALEFRAEVFNMFNHAQFENPDGDVVGSNFGQVTSARDPRIGQFALKFSF